MKIILFVKLFNISKKDIKMKLVSCVMCLRSLYLTWHDGLVKSGYVLNDETIQILIKQSLLQAQMGCDVLAPSDMMDGRVGKIRKALDKEGL